jgi:hypothetical protein
MMRIFSGDPPIGANQGQALRVAAKGAAALTGPARDGVRFGGRDERMLAARIEPKNGLQIQTAGFTAKSGWR